MGKRSRNYGNSRSREQFESKIGTDNTRRRTQGLSAEGSRVRREAAQSSLKTTGLATSTKLESAPARLMAERDRRRKRSHRKIIAILTTVFFLVAAVAGAAGIYYARLQSNLYRNKQSGEDVRGAITHSAIAGQPFNILLMGGDKRPEDKSWRSDVMILTRVDPKEKKIWMVSIPRDYKADIPGHGTDKINAAFALGQEALAIQTVEQLTGQPVNHVMTVDFVGFENVINAMDGIKMDVPQRIDDPEADFTPNKTASVIDAGPQILDGAHALTLMRSRHSYADGDFTRMKMQQLFFKALVDQMASTPKTQLLNVVDKSAHYIATDLSLGDLLELAQTFKGVQSDSLYTTTLPGVWKSPYVVPDEEGMAAILSKFENAEPFETPETQPATAVDPSKVSVTVQNGTIRNGIAKQAASILLAHGYNVGDVGNAGNQSVYQQSYVYYKKTLDQATAQRVADYLMPGTKVVKDNGLQSYSTDILVVVGQDWDLSKIPVATN
ncbi:MAG: LCP family protein [Actinomycetia bacterium]|nr:LCP family protein [Actinomycetes bacterium]